ncbi:MAG: hypothetical protein M1334_03125 [Patescibacteria group bacterium]|nr:hypothetical protein [Patescibacteria group bacterium]
MANKFSAKSGSSKRGKIKTLIIVGAITIATGISFVSIAKAQNLPNYDQVIKSLPAPVQNLSNTVKQTIASSQTPSSQNNIDSKTISNWIAGALNWITTQFQKLTGVTFSSLFSTIINFLVWLVKIVIAIVVGIVNFVLSFSKK